MEVTVDTSQIKVLQDFFDDLSRQDQKKIFTHGYRRAARPLVAMAKVTAPIGRPRMIKGKLHMPGTLMRSVGTIEVPDEVAILVGAKLSGANKGWYGRFIEGGTKVRFRNRKNKNGGTTGRMTASHWFENAYNATEKQVYDSIDYEWYKAIDMCITRVNRRLK